MKVVTVFPSYANKGGAEEISVAIARGLNHVHSSVMLHLGNHVFEGYQLPDTSFEKFNLRNIRRYHRDGAVFLSHHRKTTTYLLIMSRLLFCGKLRVVHVAHNTFTSLRHFTLFPPYNVAVSRTVKENMISYFGLSQNKVKVIYNGITDRFNSGKSVTSVANDTIRVLFLGRIDPVKQQVEFVRQTKGHLANHIHIYFGGVGKDFDDLKTEIGSDIQYHMLGLIDVNSQLPKYDYVCLFSQKEGLPLSLIEGEMFAKPLITNDIPQSMEINVNGYTGFVNHSWEEIINCINHLPFPESLEYKRLSNNSRDTYKNKFDFNKMIESYRNYIESINW